MDLLWFYFYPLCYAAVLLKFTHCAEYYTQEEELLSDYYAFYMSAIHYNYVTDNFI